MLWSAAENSDTWVHMKLKTALLFDRSVSGFNTEVSVKDGTVTLRGEAANQVQKDLTTEYAKDVEGVKAVKNEMTVAKTSVKPDKTVGEKIDDASVSSLDQCPQYQGEDEERCGNIGWQGRERSRKGVGHQIGQRRRGCESVE